MNMVFVFQILIIHLVWLSSITSSFLQKSKKNNIVTSFFFIAEKYPIVYVFISYTHASTIECLH